MSQKFYSIWERHLKCGADFVTFFGGSVSSWQVQAVQPEKWCTWKAGGRVGRPARRTGRLSSGWQCSRIQMDYQSCIKWQELKWDTAPVVLSLSSSPRSRSGLLGSWNTHAILSRHGALVSPQPHKMTVSPDRPISCSSPSLHLPCSPSVERRSGTEERDVAVV